MRKFDDFFVAGLLAGAAGGAGILFLNVVLLLIGIPHGTYWQAMGGLFYNKQLLQTWLAQLHGAIDAIGVSAANGVLTCYILRHTGKDYLYLKSACLSAFSAYFLFLAVYPQTGLGKDSMVTPWVAFFGHTVFTGLFVGYILTKIYSFDRNTEKQSRDEGMMLNKDKNPRRVPIRFRLLHPPLTRPRQKAKTKIPRKISNKN